MAGKKMVQPGEFERQPRKKNPPPPQAMGVLEKSHDLAELQVDIRPYLDGVLLTFNRETGLLLMTPRGARLIAERLLEAAKKVTTV